MTNPLINARLVYDGGDTVYIPPELGTPRQDQMQGTPAEQLIELAGRSCYDSLGKGRPSFTQDSVNVRTGVATYSEGYHDHIRKVGHGSVWEHFNVTLEVQCEKVPELLFPLFNRPGLTVRWDSPQFMRVTLNPRVVNDWNNLTLDDNTRVTNCGFMWRRLFSKELHEVAPHVVDFYEIPGREFCLSDYSSYFYGIRRVEPVYETEAWVSMFVSGSRGLSHELVRHGDFTAISQRSTRYVDESESSWVEHPLMTTFLSDRQAVADEHADDITNRINDELDSMSNSVDAVICGASNLYKRVVSKLEPWLIARGVDRTTARKQARGAARGYLGNALYTELIFSASVAQWKRILRQRASVHADAEIRELACKCLAELKRSRYGDRFENWELRPSPDGIGEVAVEVQEPVPCSTE